jgi:hypothetical protein
MDVKLEPLRSLDDFLLNSARFQVPDVSDLQRWNRRLKENLIYFQTNYFLSATIIFLIVGSVFYLYNIYYYNYFMYVLCNRVMHPSDMLLGIAAISAAYLLATYALKNQTLMNDFKKKHPLPTLLAIIALGYLLVSVVSSVLVFFFGILLPLVGKLSTKNFSLTTYLFSH